MKLLEGLPLTAKGKTKQQNELAMKVPCTLLFSFQCCFDCIKTSKTAISSLLLDEDLDAEGKDNIVARIHRGGPRELGTHLAADLRHANSVVVFGISATPPRAENCKRTTRPPCPASLCPVMLSRAMKCICC